MSAAACARCGHPTPAKRLTRISADEAICQKCLDHIPSAERRTLLRKEARRVS